MSEVSCMELISDYAWILPAVTATGWILSWWRPRRVRWSLLAAAVVISVLCVVIGFLTTVSAPTPDKPGDCSSAALACPDMPDFYWITAGAIGFACWFVLMIVTLLVEMIIRIRHRALA
jgi:hypothetical protein